MKRPASQNKRIGVLPMAFRARKVFGTFEKRTPDPNETHTVLWVSFQNGGDLIIGLNHLAMWSSAWNNTYNADNLSPHKSYIS